MKILGAFFQKKILKKKAKKSGIAQNWKFFLEKLNFVANMFGIITKIFSEQVSSKIFPRKKFEVDNYKIRKNFQNFRFFKIGNFISQNYIFSFHFKGVNLHGKQTKSKISYKNKKYECFKCLSTPQGA